jgi:hypothetical protein
MPPFETWYCRKLAHVVRHNGAGPLPTIEVWREQYDAEVLAEQQRPMPKPKQAPQPGLMQLDGKLVPIDQVVLATVEVIGDVLRRLEALEQRPQLRYAGVWRESTGYLENEMVTHQGSLWIALQSTGAKPGTTPLDWQMCTKRGRDGRDLRPESPA